MRAFRKRTEDAYDRGQEPESRNWPPPVERGSSSALQLVTIGAVVASLEQVSIVTADGFGLQLSSGLANDLARSIAVAANALPKRGLEVCGLLLGEHTENTFVVTSLVPLTCRYAEGPAFRAREPELRDELRLVEPLSNVIGFYRSRNDGSLDLDRQDELLLDLLARRPIPVLVIRQQKNTAGEGRLLVWGDSTGQEGLESVGDIFSTGQWMGVQRPVPESSRVPSDPDERAVFRSVPVRERQLLPFPEQSLVEAATATRKRDGARTKWIAFTASALLLLLLIGWRVQDLRTVPTAEQFRALSGEKYPPVVVEPSRNPLIEGETSRSTVRTSEPEGGISQDAKALQNLKSWIRNDENSTLREIAVRELARRGKDDLEALGLLAETAKTDISDSVRAAALESIARGWKVNRATRSFFEERARSDRSLAVRQTAERELANASNMSPVNSGSAAFSDPSRAAAADSNEPSTTRPNAAEPTAPLDPAPKPPQTARLFRSPRPAATAPQPVNLPLPPPVEVARNTPALPVVQAPLVAFPSRPARLIPPPARIEDTPPTLLSQNPAVSVPADIRRLVRNETVIAVTAAVDSKGRVSNIYPSEATGGLDRMLWSIYSNAVRRWVFKPARRNDVAVPGETTLHFRLSPSEGR